MAESGNRGSIGKLLQKSVSRTKEKVMQNLGRADKTTDDALDLHVNNFNEQQATFARLQKEVKQYLTSVKDMSMASDSLYRVIRETYEPTWTGHSNIALNVDQSDLWKSYMDKLDNQLLNPLTTFASHFQDVKNKIGKRNRKLTDFDVARHDVDALSKKKCDPAKLAKAEDELAEAKKIYEAINNELHTELPDMYNRRVEFLATLFNVLFVADVDFHQESAKLSDKLAAVTEELKLQSCNIKLENRRSTTESTNGESKPVQRVTPAVSSTTNAYTVTEVSQNTKVTADGQPEYEEVTSRGQQDRVLQRPASQDMRKPSLRTSYVPKPAPRLSLHVSATDKNESTDAAKSPKLGSPTVRPTGTDVPIYEVAKAVPSADAGAGIYGLEKLPEESSADVSTPSQTAAPVDEPVYHVPRPVSLATPSTSEEKAVENEADSKQKSDHEVKPEREILYRVLAMFPYHADDTDELSFEPGEIIAVVQPDEGTEQDEGWLMGLKEATSQAGMFPENFTKRL